MTALRQSLNFHSFRRVGAALSALFRVPRHLSRTNDLLRVSRRAKGTPYTPCIFMRALCTVTGCNLQLKAAK